MTVRQTRNWKQWLYKMFAGQTKWILMVHFERVLKKPSKLNSVKWCVSYFTFTWYLFLTICIVLIWQINKTWGIFFRLLCILKTEIVVVSLQLLVTWLSITFVTDEQCLRQYSVPYSFCNYELCEPRNGNQVSVESEALLLYWNADISRSKRGVWLRHLHTRVCRRDCCVSVSKSQMKLKSSRPQRQIDECRIFSRPGSANYFEYRK